MSTRRTLLAAACATVPLLGATANAQNNHSFISNGGTAIYLGLGLGLPLLQDGSEGWAHSVRIADSFVSSLILAEGLKWGVREKRPDSNSHDSFPSEHATAAFAIATMQSQYHPSEAPLWFAGASVIAYDRVRIKRHFFQDVAGGAALGYLTSRLELSSRHGLVLYPFINDNGGAGVMLAAKF